MKTLTTRLLVLLCLAAAPAISSADDRFEARHSLPAIGSGEWRLGEFRGDRGYEIMYRISGRNRWQVAPGNAMAIADGWVLGTDRHNGGYGIYRWNGRGWSRMPGTAVRIGGSYRQPWVVNERGVQFIWTGYDWREDRRVERRDDGRDDRNYRRNDRQENLRDDRDDRRRRDWNDDDDRRNNNRRERYDR